MIETQRLILRAWQDRDIQPFAQMNADPQVMKYFPATLDSEKSLHLYQRVTSLMDSQGWGWWALERKDSGEFIGATGLMTAEFDAWFTPALEVGWRLAKKHWRKGYATEAAAAALDYANNTLHVSEVVSFTSVTNKPSIGVMEKIGMQRQRPNFAHPNVLCDSPLSEHVLYKKKF